jgi:hypothetical protein
VSRISEGDLVQLKAAHKKLKKFAKLKDVMGIVVKLYISQKPHSVGKEIAVVMWMTEQQRQLSIFSERIRKVNDGRG